MEDTPPQKQEQQQEQHLVGQGHPPQPLPPTLAESGAGPERSRKRSRESPSAVCDSPNENHGAKRRQTSASRDDAEAITDTTGNATVSTRKNRIATRIIFVNEAAATIAEQVHEAAGFASKQERGAAAETMQRYTKLQIRTLNTQSARDVAAAAEEEEMSTIEASRDGDDGASILDSVPTETSTLDASKGNPSTPQIPPRSASHGAAVLEVENKENGVPESHFQTFADWQALLSGGRRGHFVSPNSGPDSDCYALHRSMLPKEHKSVPFRDPSWQYEFHRCGTYMSEDSDGLRPEATALYKELLERERPLPKKSLFDDDVIGETCERVRFKNETTLFRDITPLIAPSVELLATDHPHLGFLCESTDEVWSNSQPVVRIQPQPSYAIGFSAEAFSEEHFGKAIDFFNDLYAAKTSPMKVTADMFFPCFSLEIGPIALGERQNAHSMTIGMRGVVELFRGVSREGEVHRQILGWSIAHNHRRVEISAHYPVIYGNITNFHRTKIHSFDFSDPECDKWAAYRFTRNLYDTWMPAHFAWICSAIEKLPVEWPRFVDSIDEFQS
ncbi:hypothetical protein CCMA1212_004558 [Trichoderma ghanense]|uniref:DUF7924 domain-containing protein n=1 Tax=Trichoderma ghanense TaxID=65468 RepID=A0ABY2H5I3_9HYPO